MKLDLYTLEQIYKTFGLTILDVEKLPQDKLRDMARYVEPEDCTCRYTNEMIALSDYGCLAFSFAC